MTPAARRTTLFRAVVLVGVGLALWPLNDALLDTADAEPEVLARLEALADPPAARSPIARPALVLLLDGLRLDESERMPALSRFAESAATVRVTLEPPTFSRPAHHGMLTGVPSLATGVATNRFAGRARVDSLADRVRAAGGACAWIGQGEEWFASMHGVEGEAMEEGADSVDAALVALRSPEPPALTVVHPLAVDLTAHRTGAIDSEAHLRALVEVDDIVARAEAATRDRDIVLVVLSDHGHMARGGHGGSEDPVVRVPQLWRAPGLRPGGRPRGMLVEQTAATLAAWMGVAPPTVATSGVFEPLAPQGWSGDPTGVAERAAAFSRWQSVASAERDAARAVGISLWFIAVLLGVVALARAGALTRPGWGPVAAPPALWVTLVLAGHFAVLDRPFSLSAIDRTYKQGLRLGALGVAATLLVVAAAALLAWRRGEPPRSGARSAAAAVGVGAPGAFALAVAWLGGTMSPWPSDLGAYAPSLFAAAAAGACVTCALVLLAARETPSTRAQSAPSSRSRGST